MSNEIVKYENTLNTVPLRRFTPVDMNIFFALVARVRDKGVNEVSFTYDYLKKISRFKGHRNFNEYLKSLWEKLKTLSMESDDGERYKSIVLFTQFEIDRKKERLSVKVNSDYTYLFNELQEWTRFSLEQYTHFDSTYSKTIFRLLKQYRTIGHRKFKIDEFRRLLDIPKSYKISNIDSRIIKIAREELTPIFHGLTIVKEKHGRKVIGYNFSWRPESKKRDDFSKTAEYEKQEALRNIRFNDSLTDDEKYNAIDRLLGLKLGSTKEDVLKERAYEATPIEAEESDYQSEEQFLQAKVDELHKKQESPKGLTSEEVNDLTRYQIRLMHMRKYQKQQGDKSSDSPEILGNDSDNDKATKNAENESVKPRAYYAHIVKTLQQKEKRYKARHEQLPEKDLINLTQARLYIKRYDLGIYH